MQTFRRHYSRHERATRLGLTELFKLGIVAPEAILFNVDVVEKPHPVTEACETWTVSTATYSSRAGRIKIEARAPITDLSSKSVRGEDSEWVPVTATILPEHHDGPARRFRRLSSDIHNPAWTEM
jgi:hypothetical protein